jgi:hypothetical protein
MNTRILVLLYAILGAPLYLYAAEDRFSDTSALTLATRRELLTVADVGVSANDVSLSFKVGLVVDNIGLFRNGEKRVSAVAGRLRKQFDRLNLEIELAKEMGAKLNVLKYTTDAATFFAFEYDFGKAFTPSDIGKHQHTGAIVRGIDPKRLSVSLSPVRDTEWFGKSRFALMVDGKYPIYDYEGSPSYLRKCKEKFDQMMSAVPEGTKAIDLFPTEGTLISSSPDFRVKTYFRSAPAKATTADSRH